MYLVQVCRSKRLRAVVQRVREASVTVNDRVVGRIGHGLTVLVGVGVDDRERDALAMAGKIGGLRCFSDSSGKTNLSVEDVEGSILAVSQFTLFGDCRKGRRPSLTQAARPGPARALFDRFVAGLRERGLSVATGEFGAAMKVYLVNDGPFTLLLDTKKTF